MASADITGWLVTAACLAGTVLNVKKKRWCFHLWALGNIAWLAIDMNSRLYSRAFLDLVQLALALWGLREWKPDAER
jgi:nicotinamide riboside transporter PnuC